MSKPTIDEGSLLAYWDDAVSPETRRQIESSPELMARARELRAADRGLTRALARATCPGAAELGDYQHGLLDDEANHRIARHAAECPHCSRELVRMAELMDQLRPEIDPGIVERIKVIVADLLRGPADAGSLPPWVMPAQAGVRGAAEERSWVYRAGDYQVAIIVDLDPTAAGKTMIQGLVTGPAPSGWRADLLRDGKTLRSVPVDNHGGFEILAVPPGRAGLRLSGDDAMLVIQELQI